MEFPVAVRPMVEDDLEAADRIMRVAFGTFRGLPDPSATFGDAASLHTRFRAAPDCAWVAEIGGDVVGSVLAACWGTFGFFGPLSVDPAWWDRGVGSRLLVPVLEAFERWDIRQAGLFTFPQSPKHLGLYQKHGFWPSGLTAVLARPVAPSFGEYRLSSQGPDELEEIRSLTDAVFSGLDLGREIVSVCRQGIGDAVLIRTDGRLDGMAVCHVGAGSEAGSGACYLKFAAVRPGEPEPFERLLDACDAFAAASGAERLVAGVNTGRLDAYRRMLERGFRVDLLGLSMCLRPDRPSLDTPDQYVIDDLR